MNTRNALTKVVFLATLAALAACKKEQVDLQGAVVTAVKGTVTVTDRKGAAKTLLPAALYTKDGILMPGYQIRTGADGQVDLQFSPTMKLRIGPDTSLTLDTAKLLSAKDFEQLQLRLDHGKIFADAGKLSAASHVNIITPTAVASVRGTQWAMKEENGKNETLVKEGSVQVADDTLKESQIVEQDKKAEVSASGKVSVEPQTDADKREVADLGKDLASITDSGREQIQSLIQQFEEQKVLLQQTMDEQKKANDELMQQQKDQNQQMMQDQRTRDLENLRSQIQKDREEMDQMKSKLGADKDSITQSGKEQINQMKQQSPLSTQDATKAELEKLRKGQ